MVDFRGTFDLPPPLVRQVLISTWLQPGGDFEELIPKTVSNGLVETVEMVGLGN